MGISFPVLPLKKSESQSLADNTWRSISAALCCHAIVHLEMVMSAHSAVFRSYNLYSRVCWAQAGHGISCGKPQGATG